MVTEKMILPEKNRSEAEELMNILLKMSIEEKKNLLIFLHGCEYAKNIESRKEK